MPGNRILIVEDDAQWVEVLTERCRGLGLEVDSLTRGLDAIVRIADHSPDLVILDVNIPEGDGYSVFETMSSNPRLAAIPVVFLSGAACEDAIHRCEAMGAYYVLKGPDAWETLEPILRELLHLQPSPKANGDQRAARRGKVLIVDDDEDLLKALRDRLSQYGVEVQTATGGLQAFWKALRFLPEVVITDYKMPEGRADYLIRRLRNHPLTRHVPVIIITGRGGAYHDYGLERELLNLGVVSYFTKSIDVPALWLVVQQLLMPPETGADEIRQLESSQSRSDRVVPVPA